MNNSDDYLGYSKNKTNKTNNYHSNFKLYIIVIMLSIIVSLGTVFLYNYLTNTYSNIFIVQNNAEVPNPSEIPVIKPPVISNASPVTDIWEKLSKGILKVNNYSIESGSNELVSSGSGVYVTDTGYIITNSHVVESADKVTVVSYSGKEYDAQIIGIDKRADIAVLKATISENLPVISLGNSSNLTTGEIAIAMGYPLNQALSITSGIISSINVIVDVDGNGNTFLQTDAAINHGFSGGALINKNGELIGINTRKIADTIDNQGQKVLVEGIAYAIPIDIAKPIIGELIKTGTVAPVDFGIVTKTALDAKTPMGATVMTVNSGSIADVAGIKVGDRIVKLNNFEITQAEDIAEFLPTLAIGEQGNISIIRNNQSLNITFTVKQYFS